MSENESSLSIKRSRSKIKPETEIKPSPVTKVDETVSSGEEPTSRSEKSLSEDRRKSIKEASRKTIREGEFSEREYSENESVKERTDRRSTSASVKRKKSSKLDVHLKRASQTSGSSNRRRSSSSRTSSTSDAARFADPKKMEERVADKFEGKSENTITETPESSVRSAISTRESGSGKVSAFLECNSGKCFERPTSPPNPYNRFKYPKMIAQWPLPDHEEPRVGVVNSVASLECGFFPKSPLDHCSCCPNDKDPLDCCAKMIRTEKGCCVTEWMRKEFYYKIKSKVEKAIMRHKIFLLRGELPKLQEALEERGWVQKYEATKTRIVPYGSVASLDTNSLGNLREADGTVNEKALIFRLLRHRAPDFIWDCRNNFVDWDCTLRNDTLLNRFQKSFIYTSKLGMAHLLQSAHWFSEDGVATVNYPRSYNLTRDANAFVEDFRRTAAAGLLKWLVSEIQNGREVMDQGKTPVAVTSLDFALKKCEDFVAVERNEKLDVGDAVNPSGVEWEQFLSDYDKVLHGKNGLRITASDPQRVLEEYYVKALAVLKNLMEVDPQCELSGARNIWIVKPSDLCCGTGISISHKLEDILHKVNNRPKDYYIVQKYIEHPLLVNQTKFDIRQWYLVTNTFPLTIWMFDEALLRFSSKPFTFENYHEAIHICNTAVQEKYIDRRKKRCKIDKTDDLEESFPDENWNCERLNDYLKNVGHKGEPYFDTIYPKMTEAIVLTMLASQEYMDKRRCSFELYGADFMVTEDLVVWLIEINTNPRMHPPGLKITERLYPAVLESLVKVVFDLPLNPSADTGGFILAYKQNISEFQPYLGSCMFVFGKAMNLQDTPFSKEEERKSRGKKSCNPWGKQHRAWTAPPSMPRARDPGVVDLIDFLKSTRGTIR